VKELRLDLRAVVQRCRPDWVGTANSVGNGDKARFYPYGKTQTPVVTEQD
jgi:hypothetical protein